jgi:hypothetical protein
MRHNHSRNETSALEAAFAQIEYLNLIVVSAAAASERLPYLLAHPEIDARQFQQQMGSLVCLMQAHFSDLGNVLQKADHSNGRFADFRPLVADTCEQLAAGGDARTLLHRHIRNMFAFEDLVHADQPGDYGYIRYQGNDYALAIGWLLETLSCIECKFSMHEILGDAQNTEICTRLCFGAAVNALETWRRDLQLILPGSASVM